MITIGYGSTIEFDYLNWKGVHGHRKATVVSIYFGSNEYHPDEQWLMKGLDLDKNEMRIFAMKDMSNVQHNGSKVYTGHTDFVGNNIYEFDVLKDSIGCLGKVFKTEDGFIVTTNYKGRDIEDKTVCDCLSEELITDNKMKVVILE